MLSQRPVSFILLAEDSEEDQFFFRVGLKKTSPAVRLHCEQNGRAAIEWLNTERALRDRDVHPLPDIIVTDLKMPRASGFEFLEGLSRHPEYITIPKVVLSSSFLMEDVLRAYRLGASAFFDKPSGVGGLEEVIRIMLAFWNLSLRPSPAGNVP